MRNFGFFLIAILVSSGAAYAAPDDSTKAYQNAMETMHRNMMINYSGNADIDFVRGMLPHHQGAIDMAKIEQRYGKDPDLRDLAAEIIKAQQKEIKQMEKWQSGHDSAISQ